MLQSKPPSSDSRSPLSGVIFVLFGAIGFSAKAILIKLAYFYPIDAATLLTLRMGFSLPFFLGIAVWSSVRNRGLCIQRKDWLFILALGLIGYYLASYLDFLGLQYISAGLERLILFVYPTIVVLLSALIFRRPVTLRETTAILLSYAGIALAFLHDISFNQNQAALGGLLVLGSALSYAIYLIGSGPAIRRFGVTRFTAYVMIFSCSAVIFQFAATHNFSALKQPLRVYELGLGMALFSTVLPSFLISAGIRRIGAGRASLVGSVGPVATIVLASIFLNEPITVLQIAGTLLVCAGTLAVSGIRFPEKILQKVIPAGKNQGN